MRFPHSNPAIVEDSASSRGHANVKHSLKLRVVLIHPKGAILPPEMQLKHIKAQNFLERLSLGASDAVSLIEVSAREAELISQYSDVFGLDFMVLTGLPNAQYDTVWNMYTATFERVSLETLPSFLLGISEITNAPARSDELTAEQLGDLS